MKKNSEERDKLLQELAYLDQAEYIDKRVCHKLVEIVEGYFKYKYLDNDPECYHVDDMQKQVVTLRWVNDLSHSPYKVKIKMLKGLGIDVADSEQSDPIEEEANVVYKEEKAPTDPDTQEGVELIPWLNQLRSDIKLGLMNPQWRYTPQDRDYDNLGMLKQLLQQKPQKHVTRMQVRKLYSTIYREARSQKDMRDIIIKWLKELGIGVKEVKE